MKATGIVRRIDDLGRIVVPKEIRRTLRIREGDPLEIFTDREGEIILKKYSPIGELGQFAGEYAESLAQTTGYLVLVTDCDHVIAASGSGKKEFEEKPVSRQLEEAISEKIAEEAEAKRLAKRQEVVNFALQFEGNPYVYGGTSLTNGADCSGFVMSVFANFGYSLPRVAAAQCDASTKKDISQLEPGDLVFYGNGYIDHVALYIGDGKIIHASNAATGIKISDYDYEQPAAVGTFME